MDVFFCMVCYGWLGWFVNYSKLFKHKSLKLHIYEVFVSSVPVSFAVKIPSAIVDDHIEELPHMEWTRSVWLTPQQKKSLNPRLHDIQDTWNVCERSVNPHHELSFFNRFVEKDENIKE